MKKIAIFISLLSLFILGCSNQKFESYKEADQALMKGIVDGKIDLDDINKKFAAKGVEFTEEAYEYLEKYSKMHFEEDGIEISRTNNVTHIVEKPAEPFDIDMNILWTYEDGTYKIEDIEVYE